jgi:hypothetical protein
MSRVQYIIEYKLELSEREESEMKMTRLYTGLDGKSHFEDVDIPLNNIMGAQKLSEQRNATGIIFRETSEAYDLDWHNAPRRQYIINLEGGVEITVDDGDSRIFGPGDVFLAEDITGRGHKSRAVNNLSRKSIYVTLD